MGKASKEEGYTLTEILIAITVLAFGLMAVATMQVTAIRTNAIASGMSQGLNLAQAKMEELMNLSYTHTELSDLDGDGTNQDADDDGVDDDGGNFGLNDTKDGGGAVISDSSFSSTDGKHTVFWNIAVDVPVTDTKTIRLIVTWTERGREKRITLDFVRTNLS